MKNTLTTWKLRYRSSTKQVDTFAELQGGTFDTRYLNRDFKPETRDVTPFKEIEFAPLSVPKKYAHILGKQKLWKGDLESFAVALKEGLKKHLKAVWPKDKPVLFMCSAGYDSRIILGCLKELVDEGMSTGIMHIRCHQPENEIFYKIMKSFPKSSTGGGRWIYSGDENLPTENHYDIGGAVNGWIPFFLGMNFWRDIVEDEKDWVCLSGLGGGEIFDYPIRGMGTFRNFDHCKNPFINRWLNHFLYNHEYAGQLHKKFDRAIFPYFGYEYLDIASQCRPEWIEPIKANRKDRPGPGWIDQVRHAILSTFEVTTLDIEYGPGHRYEWGLSTKHYQEMKARFRASKFAKENGLKDIKFLNSKGKHDPHAACMYGFAMMYEGL